jgi:predicted CXXCH cytochrome family protein
MRWPATWAALMVAAGACADIRETPHSLVRGSGNSKVEASEVCVFCHTPTLTLPAGELRQVVPAWQQKSLSPTHSFTLYDDIGRAQYGNPTVGSQSIACLSCHDSNQAFSVTRLSYDHPFGVPYRGFQRGRQTIDKPARDNEAPASEGKHVKALEEFHEPSKAVVDNRVVWWVSTTRNPVLRSRSDLPLYARPDQLSGGEIPYVECSSCHDPHTSNPLFLRVTNQGSRLCLTCHDK